MGVTVADCLWSAAKANEISQWRIANGHDISNHFAKNLSFEETLRRGLLTECAFANEFGLAVDGELRIRGDGGRDFLLRLRANGGVDRFIVNVKSKSVRTNNFAGMVRVGTHLRVSVSEIQPDTIYVFGIYWELWNDADVLRWQWGRSLIARNQRMTFENGNDKPAFVYPYEKCRLLGELKDRLAN